MCVSRFFASRPFIHSTNPTPLLYRYRYLFASFFLHFYPVNDSFEKCKNKSNTKEPPKKSPKEPKLPWQDGGLGEGRQ